MKTVNGKFGLRRSVSGHARSTRTLRDQHAAGRGVTILLMSVALLWISISPRFAIAQSLKEIRVGSSNISVTNVVAYYARDRKFFEAEGFDAKIIIIKTEAALAALSAGDLDYSTLSTSSIEGTLKGLPLRFIAVTNRHPLLGLVVGKGIDSVADLRERNYR